MLSRTAWVLALLMAPIAAQAKPHVIKVMVLDIPVQEGMRPATVKTMQEFLSGAVHDLGFAVVTSSDLQAVLGVERQKELLGCTESGCLAELGGALGVDYIIRGTAAQLGDTVALTLTLVDAKGETVNEKRQLLTKREDAELVNAVQTLVPGLLAPIRAASPSPPQDVPLAAAPAATSSNASTAAPATAASGANLVARPAATDSGSSAGKIAGVSLVVGGPVLMVGSFIVGAIALSQANAANSTAQAGGAGAAQAPGQRTTAVAEAWASTGMLAGGVIAVGVGIVLLATGGHSSSTAALAAPNGAPALALNF